MVPKRLRIGDEFEVTEGLRSAMVLGGR